ncbi:hypothetical protein F4804DRAFT_248914 [Jackrogersella minutella]|nr:hypothetical protein F4804DRAFT_248914 [Jackrogersella minutella]
MLMLLSTTQYGEFDLIGDRCSPKSTHFYPICLNDMVDGAGVCGHIRVLQLHPANKTAVSFHSLPG